MEICGGRVDIDELIGDLVQRHSDHCAIFEQFHREGRLDWLHGWRGGSEGNELAALAAGVVANVAPKRAAAATEKRNRETRRQIPKFEFRPTFIHSLIPLASPLVCQWRRRTLSAAARATATTIPITKAAPPLWRLLQTSPGSQYRP